MALVRPKIRDDLAFVVLDGEAVIYDTQNQNIHHLNPTATLLFELFDGSATVPDLAADIGEAFGMPAEDAEVQIRHLMRQFRKAQLLEKASR